jgi:hypothetical protein
MSIGCSYANLMYNVMEIKKKVTWNLSSAQNHYSGYCQ